MFLSKWLRYTFVQLGSVCQPFHIDKWQYNCLCDAGGVFPDLFSGIAAVGGCCGTAKDR